MSGIGSVIGLSVKALRVLRQECSWEHSWKLTDSSLYLVQQSLGVCQEFYRVTNWSTAVCVQYDRALQSRWSQFHRQVGSRIKKTQRSTRVESHTSWAMASWGPGLSGVRACPSRVDIWFIDYAAYENSISIGRQTRGIKAPGICPGLSHATVCRNKHRVLAR